MFRRMLVFVAAVSLSSAAVAGEPFTGNFEGEGGALTLRQKGKAVTGTSRMGEMELPVTGRISGTTLKASVKLPGGDSSSFTATRSGNELVVEFEGSPPTRMHLAGEAPAADSQGQADSPAPAGEGRRITINKQPLSPERLEALEQLEQQSGGTLPDGAYWYDARSGAAGRWGGPTVALLPAGLDLAGPMPANCSGGKTGVYVNGRRLPSQDLAALERVLGKILPGRYWLEGNGDYGQEGGGTLGNLRAAVARATQAGQRSSGGEWSVTSKNASSGDSWVGGDGKGFMYFTDSKGNSVFVNH